MTTLDWFDTTCGQAAAPVLPTAREMLLIKLKELAPDRVYTVVDRRLEGSVITIRIGEKLEYAETPMYSYSGEDYYASNGYLKGWVLSAEEFLVREIARLRSA